MTNAIRPAVHAAGLLVLLASVGELGIPAECRAQRVSYTGAVEYAAGDYIFTQRTSSMALLSGLSLEVSGLRLSASVPLVYQSAPWLIEASTAEALAPDTVVYSDLGLADPVLYIDIPVVEESGMWPAVSLTGGVKPPLASVERGFGTGEWDYAGGLELARSLGTAVLIADVSYWRLGDSPDLVLHDPLGYVISLGAPLGARTIVTASFSGYTEIIEGDGAIAQIGAGLGFLAGTGRILSGTVAVGLTASSPDVIVSLGWQVGL
jgi:hypothetical protein